MNIPEAEKCTSTSRWSANSKRNPTLDEIHSVSSITVISSVLQFSLILFSMRCRRSGASATERRTVFSTRNSALHSTGSMVLRSNSSYCQIFPVYGKIKFLKSFSSIKGGILHRLLFPRHKQPAACLQLLQTTIVFKIFSK